MLVGTADGGTFSRGETWRAWVHARIGHVSRCPAGAFLGPRGQCEADPGRPPVLEVTPVQLLPRIPAFRAGLVAAGALVGARASAQCREWTPGFHVNGMNAPILTLRALDDGSGPRLYAGGTFTVAGEALPNSIASFDGTTWSTLGSGSSNGANHRVNAVLLHDDGSGPAVFVGGNFTEIGGVFSPGIARWNGTSFSALSFATDNEVLDLAVFDAGSGPELHAAGFFTTIDGTAAQHVARWNGTSWSPVGGGTSHAVRVLHVHDDGSGPKLFAGGDFASAGGVTAQGIARWNGTSWSAVASGLGGSVRALATYTDGGVRKLAVGGTLNSVAGLAVGRIASFDGTSWATLGSGMNLPVNALIAFDDGSGPALWAGGEFTSAGGVPSVALAKWNGTSWSNPGAGIAGGDNGGPTHVHAIEVFDDPVAGEPRMCVAGTFTNAGGTLANRIIAWNGTSWSIVGERGNGFPNRWFQSLSGLTVHAGGSEPVLCASGRFEFAGGAAATNVAQWNGTSWAPLGALTSTDQVDTIASVDLGAGPELFASAEVAVAVPGVFRWNGTAWDVMGNVGFQPTEFLAFDDGGGRKLYAGGFGPHSQYVGDLLARWNGTSWEGLLGGGLQQFNDLDSMVVHDDGSGPALYVGGFFFSIGSPAVAAWNVARWNGTSWTSLGTSASGLGTGVTALAVFDDGTGPRLFAGGNFSGGVKRWEGGTTWSHVGGGLGSYAPVYDFEVFDDGSGPALYATGQLSPANGAPSGIARWNGTSWSSLGTGIDGGAALATYDDGRGSGPALYAVGGMYRAGSVPSSRIARWGGCRVKTFCAGDGLDPNVTTPCPCANTGTAGHGCAWSGSSGGALLELDGRIDPDTAVLRGSLMPGTTTAIYLKGDTNTAAGIVFGDGVRCIDGALIRLAIKQNSGGASQYPEAGNLPLSVRGATPPGSGLTGWYQTYYRSASPTFCPPATFNVTNGVMIRW